MADVRRELFHAPEYPSPDWRPPWVERLSDEDAFAHAEAPGRG